MLGETEVPNLIIWLGLIFIFIMFMFAYTAEDDMKDLMTCVQVASYPQNCNVPFMERYIDAN